MTEHETWDPHRVRKVDSLDGLRELIFDSLADPLGRMACDCPDCAPAPHKTAELALVSGVIEIEIDGRVYKITVQEGGVVDE